MTLPDEFHLLGHRAIMHRVGTLLSEKGMLTMDAFRAFDTDRNGALGCSELYAGMCWLGLDDDCKVVGIGVDLACSERVDVYAPWRAIQYGGGTLHHVHQGVVRVENQHWYRVAQRADQVDATVWRRLMHPFGGSHERVRRHLLAQ